MEKKIKKASILTGTILTGALLTLTSNADARPATSKVLGNGAELRSEIIDLNITSSMDNVFELKCGEDAAKTKPADAKQKEAKDKSTEAKCGEGKCGEGKCGAKDDSKSAKVSKDSGDVKATEAKAVDTKEAKKDKAAEAKCGEGKCGESSN